MTEALLLPLILPPHALSGVRAPPATFILYGPPGTGKTSLVRAAAAISGRKLITVGPGDVLSKWTGEGEQALRRLFAEAMGNNPTRCNDKGSRIASVTSSTSAPPAQLRGDDAATNGGRSVSFSGEPDSGSGGSTGTFPGKDVDQRGVILFFDEIDALAPSRGDASGGGAGTGGGASSAAGGGDLGSRRLLAELLLLMNEIDRHGDDDADQSDDHEDERDDGDSGDASSLSGETSDSSLSDELAHAGGAPTTSNGAGGCGRVRRRLAARSAPKPLIVAATNRLCDVDEALLRRFTRKVHCPLPEPLERAELLHLLLQPQHGRRGAKAATSSTASAAPPAAVSSVHLCSKIPGSAASSGGARGSGSGSGSGHVSGSAGASSDVSVVLSDEEWTSVVLRTEGWSGSDMRALVAEAVRAPLREATAALLAAAGLGPGLEGLSVANAGAGAGAGAGVAAAVSTAATSTGPPSSGGDGVAARTRRRMHTDGDGSSSSSSRSTSSASSTSSSDAEQDASERHASEGEGRRQPEGGGAGGDSLHFHSAPEAQQPIRLDAQPIALEQEHEHGHEQERERPLSSYGWPPPPPQVPLQTTSAVHHRQPSSSEMAGTQAAAQGSGDAPSEAASAPGAVATHAADDADSVAASSAASAASAAASAAEMGKQHAAVLARKRRHGEMTRSESLGSAGDLNHSETHLQDHDNAEHHDDPAAADSYERDGDSEVAAHASHHSGGTALPLHSLTKVAQAQGIYAAEIAAPSAKRSRVGSESSVYPADGALGSAGLRAAGAFAAIDASGSAPAFTMAPVPVAAAAAATASLHPPHLSAGSGPQLPLRRAAAAAAAAAAAGGGGREAAPVKHVRSERRQQRPLPPLVRLAETVRKAAFAARAFRPVQQLQSQAQLQRHSSSGSFAAGSSGGSSSFDTAIAGVAPVSSIPSAAAAAAASHQQQHQHSRHRHRRGPRQSGRSAHRSLSPAPLTLDLEVRPVVYADFGKYQGARVPDCAVQEAIQPPANVGHDVACFVNCLLMGLPPAFAPWFMTMHLRHLMSLAPTHSRTLLFRSRLCRHQAIAGILLDVHGTAAGRCRSRCRCRSRKSGCKQQWHSSSGCCHRSSRTTDAHMRPMRARASGRVAL